MKRVVVTGVGAITALGNDWGTISQKFRDGQTAVRRMEEWSDISGLRTLLGAPVTDFEKPEHYSRKQTRSMGRGSLMSTRATEVALTQAGLLDDPIIQDGRMGIAYGSCSGSSKAVADFAGLLLQRTTRNITATTYVEMMSHTCAVNTGLFFGLKGRVIPTASACTSGSQGVGYAYEAIKYGHQSLMVAGGAEELCPTQVAVFDTLFATSQKNDTPQLTPQPFDRDRDGLVIGEGACSLILEELEHAQARGAKIYAEVVGYATNSDGRHITSPTADTMEVVMRQALANAELDPAAIGYVNAHGTATEQGDIAETNATSSVFGPEMAISSLKSYYGHSLGACGAIEAWLTIEMMNSDWYAGTANLNNVDERCGELNYLRLAGGNLHNEYVMSNNFAFGGINTSLIFKRWA
ncbi:beta-ketoacyl-ACP synthase [Halioxenophilus sp. WMMB6]|uniref:beta-ketoacyl-ACP synthase n=1 Tax=Halioxenophilus sp. WMMB6 TaxID=3073815 RepID=UPI00295E2181|nr:beta-ketoacyl-ACP synthase [Halioxenophilus sp. WMMB6]